MSETRVVADGETINIRGAKIVSLIALPSAGPARFTPGQTWSIAIRTAKTILDGARNMARDSLFAIADASVAQISTRRHPIVADDDITFAISGRGGAGAIVRARIVLEKYIRCE
jgi:hypothetical protein